MSDSPLDRLADDFERLRLLHGSARDDALLALDISDADRELLNNLLAADDDTHDPMAAAVSASAIASGSGHPGSVGAWRLLSELGSGGMGKVYLAERADGSYQQQVALKLLRGFPDDDSLRRFRQERQILASLEHPNIARLIDGGETSGGQPWLAIEHVDGERLLHHVASKAPEPATRLDLFDAMLAAVEHAHQRLVIHRDLKPANVMVRRDGVVKLLDFGIARLIDEMADDESTSTQVYSPGYASPEQRNGQTITTTSDIYSLGILLSELMTGQRAGRNAKGVGVASKGLDAQLAAVIAKASADDPRLRYASVGAFRDDLRRYRAGRPVLATQASSLYRIGKFIARHRFAALASLLAVSTLLLGMWRLSSERNRAVAAEARATAALASSERDSASARAALDFVVETFSAAAPDRALSQQVSVRDLLDHARQQLDQKLANHPGLLQPLQRLLGHLYMKMGAGDVAVDLLQRGLRDATADSPAAAARLAADFSEQAEALIQVERLDDAAQALVSARQLREHWLPQDRHELARSLSGEASLLHHRGDNPNAIVGWRNALAALDQNDPAMADTVIDIWQSLAGALGNHGDFAEALSASRAALAAADRHLPANSPERVPLLRAEANAMAGLGNLADAEAALRSAIALQEHSVGSTGVRMGTLYNDLGVTLNGLDRYSEAVTALEHSRELGRPAKSDGVEDTATLMNIASVYENAGDYPRALALSTQALDQMKRSGMAADSSKHRLAERLHARKLMVIGRLDEARNAAIRLREQARTLDGTDSFEYASLTWLLTQIARRQADPNAGLPLLDEAKQRFAALVPEGHPLFAQTHRVRAAFALQQGQLDVADREMALALEGFSKAGAALDLAIARSELARLRWRQQRRGDARDLLQQSLPALRSALLANELHRAPAEKLARQLGLGTAP